MSSIKEGPELTLKILKEYSKKDIESLYDLCKLIPEHDEETLALHLRLCIENEFIDGNYFRNRIIR